MNECAKNESVISDSSESNFISVDLDVAKALARVWKNYDLSYADAYFSDNVVFTLSDHNTIAGKQAVYEYFKQYFSKLEGDVNVEVKMEGGESGNVTVISLIITVSGSNNYLQFSVEDCKIVNITQTVYQHGCVSDVAKSVDGLPF